MADGLQRMPPDSDSHAQQPGHLVAAADGHIRRHGQLDYGWHLWRLDDNGHWSHKHGGGPVEWETNGRPLRDPRHDLGEFCEFFVLFWVSHAARARLAYRLAQHHAPR